MFFKIDLWNNNGESINPYDAMVWIDKNTSLSSGDRYIESTRYNYKLSVKFERIKEEQILGKIGKTRFSDFPYIESGGKIDPLKLPEGKGLYDPSHFILYPHNILVGEINRQGPTMYALGNYIKQVHPEVEKAKVIPIAEKQLINKLKAIRKVLSLKVQVYAAGLSNLERKTPGLYRVLNNQKEFVGGNPEIIEFYANVKRGDEEGLNPDFISDLPDLIQDEEFKESFKALKIKAELEEDYMSEVLNIFAHYVSDNVFVTDPDPIYRAIDPREIYLAIDQVYQKKIKYVLNDV